MTANVEFTPITSLPSTAPTATDILLLIVAGIAKQAQLGDVREALAVATAVEKGLMSAADKVNLNDVVTKLAAILSPVAVTIASASTINVPANTTFVILTGTTTITGITGLTTNRPCWFYYPSGAGVTLQLTGVNTTTLVAGDAPIEIIQTAT